MLLRKVMKFRVERSYDDVEGCGWEKGGVSSSDIRW